MDGEPWLDPLLDEEVWKGLEYVEKVAGPGAIAEMVDNYIADVPDRLRKLHEALEARDAEAFNHLAHDLKSNSATLGIPSLQKLGWELERLSGEGRLDPLFSILEHVEARIPEILNNLARKRADYA